MNESIAVAKEADAKKSFSSARRNDKSIQLVRDESERQLDSLGGVIGNIRSDGAVPSAESIATELGSRSAGARAPALLALQQTHGNRYVQRVVSGIQAKLEVSEQEVGMASEQTVRSTEETTGICTANVKNNPTTETEEPETIIDNEEPETIIDNEEPETISETEESEGEEASTAGGVIAPVRIVRSKNLWWFDGENAANYDEETKLTAFGRVAGATRGTFQWDVVRGAHIVDFQNNADSMTRVNANRIGVKSTNASAAMGDVLVRCRWNQGSVTRTLYHHFTVRAPSAGVVVSGPNDSVDPRVPAGSGFQTLYSIEVRDQFGRRLPRRIEVNETFGAWVSDFAGENWPVPAQISAMSNPSAQVSDTYAHTCPACTPPTVNPGAAGAGTTVQHATQRYRAGSLAAGRGRLIKTHSLQFYRGGARQL